MSKVYTITGGVPSKKNSRINTRSGRSFPSKEYRAWHETAGLEIQSQGIKSFTKPVEIEVKIYFKNNIRQDLDNRLSSILDLLVDLGVIEDDRWQCVPEIEIKGYLDRNNPRAEIYIEEYSDD